jgi:5'-methylthioadenosine phosphorylase
MIGLIGGTGIYDTSIIENAEERLIDTAFGEVTLYIGSYQGRDLVFLPRHGLGHNVLAPQVNHYANMQALADVGVDAVFATAAVGSMNLDMKGGDLVLLDQFVDFTAKEAYSYGTISVNMTDPYCPELRAVLQETAEERGISLHPRATYFCLDGPRYETKAEIRLFRNWGMDVLGMTGAPEAILAREQGMHYASVGIVTNYCAGIGEDVPDLASHRNAVKENMDKIKDLVFTGIQAIPETFTRCDCREYYAKAMEARK